MKESLNESSDDLISKKKDNNQINSNKNLTSNQINS